MHGTEIFVQLGILLISVTVMAAIMRQLKQPLILGHILTGLIIGIIITAFPAIKIDVESFDIFASLGIALLLFIIGLDLKLSVFRQLENVLFGLPLSILLGVGGLGLLI